MTVTLQCASQNMLRYLVTASGAGSDTTALTQARMITDCSTLPFHPGPLKAKLSSSLLSSGDAPAIVAWAELPLDPELSVYVSPGTTSPAVIGYAFAHPGADNIIELTALAAGSAYVEIRFNPTIDR